MKYYQGDTIRFDIGAGEGFDPTDIDFTARVYKYVDGAVIIPKASMKRMDDGTYRATIPSETTAAMNVGRYTVELLVKQPGGVNSIACGEAFELLPSASKNEFA